MDNNHADLGYIFHAFPSGSSLGYAQLDVFLVTAGGDRGFAPAQLSLPAWEQNGAGGMTRLALTVQWAGAAEIHVAPGIVTILSYGGGEQTAYCFGGALSCRRDNGRLHCLLTSSAPILNIGEEGMDWSENVVLRVVDGIESEIAAARARHNGEAEPAFEERLARTDPRLLYAVGLTLAQQSFARLPDLLRTEHYWDEYNVLTRALHEAQDSPWWPSEPTLAAVLPPQPR
jgi:hypothetical protein